jgi:O-antigen biosynthesis protein
MHILPSVNRGVALGVGTADTEDHETGALSADVQPLHPRLIAWTGERCVPWAPDHQMVYEHMHRYNFAASFCTGKRVLDLASGEGYGSAILGAVASEVAGIDIDSASVDHARLTYGTDQIRFIEGSMLDPDLFRDHFFDVVVCFEALEHVGDHDLLMQVILGALRSDGLAVISTPDRTVYTDLHEQKNPFHVHELDRQEFRDLLGRHFKHADLLTQEVATGSVMQALDGGQGGELIRVSATDDWTLQPAGAPPFLVALASDAPLPPIPSVSTLVDTDLLLAQRPRALTQLQESVGRTESDLVEPHVKVARFQTATAEREAEVVRLHTAATEREADIEQLQRTATERESEVARLEAQASRQDAQIERLEDSVRALADEGNIAETARAAAVDELHAHAAAVAQLTWEVGAIKATRGWRALEIMRRRYRQARRLGRPLRRLLLFRRAPR